MNKITSILFLYITFLPAFSYAAFPDNIMTGMDGVLYTNQSAHATNTDEYVANFAPNPSLLSTDTNTQQQYKEQFEEPNNSNYTAPQKKEVQKNKKNDATTSITVSVVDHYDSSKKIKDIEICYENIDSCKTTNKNGIAKFTHKHIATEEISPIISVKPSSDYHCNEPTNTHLDTGNLTTGFENSSSKTTTNKNSFSFIVKCKQLCTDKELKKVPNATACYVRGKKDYEILRCAADYTNIDNKCEPNPKLPVKEKIGKVNLTKTSEQKKLEEQVKLASEEQIKKLTKETIDKINNYCKEEENKDVCDKQDETINAINEAQNKALKKLNEQQ